MGFSIFSMIAGRVVTGFSTIARRVGGCGVSINAPVTLGVGLVIEFF